MNLRIIITCLLASTFFLCSSCDNDQNEAQEGQSDTIMEVKPEDERSFAAVPMPRVLSSGNRFPTPAYQINNWIKKSKTDKNLETQRDIIMHGWDIWEALTEFTDEADNGQNLRRFETWFTPQDIIDAYNQRGSDADFTLDDLVRTHTGILEKPSQHGHINPSNDLTTSDPGVVGFVKYDPSAAKHIYNNNLYYTEQLKKYLAKDTIGKIPDFPTSGVVIKPVFWGLDSSIMVNGNEVYPVPAWPGDGGDPNRSFGHEKWNNDIYISTTNQSNPATNTYNINDFIHFQLDNQQISDIIFQNGKKTSLKAGDYAVLLGMHVTTREITRWTWQTFWWSQNPKNPNSPSNRQIASLKPRFKRTDPAVSHYAMATAYHMVDPAKPERASPGASGDYHSVYAYNPYLEAGFDKSVFCNGNAVVQAAYPNDPKVQWVGDQLNQWGMQTNCMSCHGQAAYVPNEDFLCDTKIRYLTDQYFSMAAPYFNNTVTLDFTWSIQGNLIKDPIPGE